MPQYTVQFKVNYSGRETITVSIDADNEEEAYLKAENYNLDEDNLIFRDLDIDVQDVNITKISDEPPRCTQTKELF